MRSVSVPRAVRMMIGTPERARIVRQTSRPSPSGRWRSSRIRSGSRLSASSSARAAVPATCGSKPSRASALENGSEIERSSSTNRMRGRSGIAMRRNVEEVREALPRFNPALAAAWRVGVDPARHEAITPSDRRRGDRGRPRRPRHRRARLGLDPRHRHRRRTPVGARGPDRDRPRDRPPPREGVQLPEQRVALRAVQLVPERRPLHGGRRPRGQPGPPAPRARHRRRRLRRLTARTATTTAATTTPTTTAAAAAAATTTAIRRPRRRRRQRRARPRSGPAAATMTDGGPSDPRGAAPEGAAPCRAARRGGSGRPLVLPRGSPGLPG